MLLRNNIHVRFHSQQTNEEIEGEFKSWFHDFPGVERMGLVLEV